MKYIITFILITTYSLTSYCHESFFAFAEMEYNESSKCFELTLTVSTHDVEHWLQDKGLKVSELEEHYADSALNRQLESTLLKGFSISSLTFASVFQIAGYEVLNTGVTEFYFKAIPNEISFPFTVKFDLLMDSFPEQQNKLTFIYRGKKQTYSFLTIQKEQIISLP